MSLAERTFVVDDPLICLRRLQEYMRPYPAKVLAETIDCTPKTAEKFRNGESWPNARHWRSIVRAFGRDVIAAVFEPEIDDTLARLRREERQLEERLELARARRRQVAGGLDSIPELHASSADRAPVASDEARP